MFFVFTDLFPIQSRAGEAAKRQFNTLTRTGVFDLLATVAGQILQDDGVQEPNVTKQGHQEVCKEKSLSADSQLTSLESKDLSSIDKPQCREEALVNVEGHTRMYTMKEDASLQVISDGETMSCVVRTPSQEEERKSFVKEISVDEGHGAPVHINTSPLEDQVSFLLNFEIMIIACDYASHEHFQLQDLNCTNSTSNLILGFLITFSL